MNAIAGANHQLQLRKDAAMPRGFANLHPVYAARADNARLWDVEGRSFIDCTSGISVVNTGHLHPRVVAAVDEADAGAAMDILEASFEAA